MDLAYQITARVQEITTTYVRDGQNKGGGSSSKTKKRPQYLFPSPSEEDLIICEHERVIKIYNKYNNDTRKKLTTSMEQWFMAEAKRCGWTEVKFVKYDGSTKKASLLVKNVQ